MNIARIVVMHPDAIQVSSPVELTTAPLWQHQLSLLMESTGEGIFGVDLQGDCVFINRAGARMLGLEPDQVRGRNMHELAHHTHADGSAYPDSNCPIMDAFRQGLPCRIDTELFWRSDQTAFPVEYSSYPIIDGDQVCGAVITFNDITERKREADALRRAKEDLELRVAERTSALTTALDKMRELSAYLDQVREDERTRIAREVHDELGSLLVVLKMDVNWVDKRLSEQATRSAHEADTVCAALRSKCQGMSRMIDAAVHNVGRIITDLRPSILDHQGLWAALEWQAHEFVQSAELQLDWHMEIDAAVALPEAASMAVFRIFQEMLSNVGRHARATRIDIHIGADRQLLSLSVADNGVGAAPEAFEAATAYGVMGMRERARHLGGQITVSSQAGHGTLLSLTLPLGTAA